MEAFSKTTTIPTTSSHQHFVVCFRLFGTTVLARFFGFSFSVHGVLLFW
jgi:hypothetical protein